MKRAPRRSSSRPLTLPNVGIGSVVSVLLVLLAACGGESAPTASPSVTLADTHVAQSPGESVASASPSETAAPWAVEESEEADALFSDPDTCTNPELGRTITFPDDWYTNTAIGDVAACSWFTPDFFEADASGAMPGEIWISIHLFDGLVGYTMLTPNVTSENIEIGGLSGHRSEYRILESVTDSDSDDLSYHYVLPFDTRGPTLVAGTDTQMADDYKLAKAVLDRMMATIELDPR